MPRDTYAQTDALTYRLRAAGALIGVTDNTIRGYADNAGIPVMRASDLNPDAPAIRVFTPDVLFRIAHWRREQGYIKGPVAGAAPVVITVDVIKGGTGKTTSACELALHLQLLGLRCLLIDLDVQANATQMMGYEPDLTLEEAPAYDLSERAIVTDTLASVLLPFIDRQRGSARHPMPKISPIKMPFGSHGPHLVPADTFLGDIEQALANAKGQRELYLKRLLDESFRGNVPSFSVAGYDVVIFDCPPSVSYTSSSALAAADIVLAPIRMDAFSVKGLVKLMSELGSLDEAFHVRPDLVILPTHYAPQLSRIGRMQVQLQRYRDLLLGCSITASEEFPKSLDHYLPLTLQRPTCTPSKEYRMVAEQMMPRILATASDKLRRAKAA